MDFHSLNRRELQSLCKLNKIPANITNLAMADALESLDSVEGIEEILNIGSPEKVQVMSPRTTCRTSTRQKVKKTEPATASRTTGRGDVNELLKTPSVRKKVPATASRPKVLTQLNECEQVTSTVQGVYSTRRSTRLTAKKCAEQGVMVKEPSEPVKICSFLDNTIPEITTATDAASIHELSVSCDNKEDNGEHGSDEKEKVKDICSAFEKLDVLVGHQDLAAQKPLHMDATPQSVAENEDCISEADSLKANSFESFEHHKKFDDLDEKSLKRDSDAEEKSMVIDDQNEALNVSDDEHNAYLAPEEHLEETSVRLDDSEIISKLCEDGDSEEKNDQNGALDVSVNEPDAYFEEKIVQVDHLKQVYEAVMSDLCENEGTEELFIKDEKVDLSEALIVSGKEHNAYLAVTDGTDVSAIYSNNESPSNPSKEDSTSEASFEIFEHHEKLDDLDEKSLKTDSDGMSTEEKSMAIDDQNEALNVSDNEHNAYLAPEEHLDETSVQLDDSKIISKLSEDGEDSEEKNDQNGARDVSVNKPNAYFEEKIVQVDDLKQDSESEEVMSDLCENGGSEELFIKDESLIVSVKEQNAYLAETDNAIYPSKLISEDIEMKIDVSECIDNLNAVDAENIQEDISNTDNAVPVNFDELDSNMNFEAPKEAQDSTPVFLLNSELYQETDADKETIANDVIDNSLFSDSNDNSGTKLQAVIVEEAKSIIGKTGDEKPPVSIRQLKKQLKALSLKAANKDDNANLS